MGKQRWRFDETKPGKLKILASRFAHEKIKIFTELAMEAVDLVVEVAARLRHPRSWFAAASSAASAGEGGAGPASGAPVRRLSAGHAQRSKARTRRLLAGGGAADSECGGGASGGGGESGAFAEGLAAARERVEKKYMGLALVYLSWAVMAWIVFACARAPKSPPAHSRIGASLMRPACCCCCYDYARLRPEVCFFLLSLPA